ncbi:MAG: hypothetical protein K0Q87_183 [Neobacillus sp.]|jgi:hypothetical protein|nr:hypothetical protein [Neobacillus sp.]
MMSDDAWNDIDFITTQKNVDSAFRKYHQCRLKIRHYEQLVKHWKMDSFALQEIQIHLASAKKYVEFMDDEIRSMNDIQRRLIDIWYFSTTKKPRVSYILENLHISRSNYFRIKRDTILQLASIIDPIFYLSEHQHLIIYKKEG